uniref:Uncharacterized protein n=1 Tax=Avena sativa TaxID=4498 RepID=A0ACD5ZVV7_AVESA
MATASSAPSAAATSSAQSAAAAPRTSSFPAADYLVPMTRSSCRPELAEGKHLFHVDGYPFLKCLGVGKFIKSGTFDVGGYSWAVLFYPAGSEAAPGGQHHVSVYLQLMTPNVEVWASFDLRLLEQSNGQWHSLFRGDKPRQDAVFSTSPTNRPLHHPPRCWGVPFWNGSNLQTPAYVKNGNLTIRCDITVIRLPPSAAEPVLRIEAPPPSLSNDLRKDLEEKDAKDVTVRVRGEAFPAHRVVLAARSPVLRRKLLDATDETVEITMDDDMEPAVFKAMLHFIYNDELPPDAKVCDDGGDETLEFVRRLFIAAQGWGIERLKETCESILCRNLSKQTLKATVVFASRHRCDKLKAACVEFHAGAYPQLGPVVRNFKRGPEAREEGAGDSGDLPERP